MGCCGSKNSTLEDSKIPQRKKEEVSEGLRGEERHVMALREKDQRDIEMLDRRIEELETALGPEREQKEHIAYMRLEDVEQLNEQLDYYKRRLAAIERK